MLSKTYHWTRKSALNCGSRLVHGFRLGGGLCSQDVPVSSRTDTHTHTYAEHTQSMFVCVCLSINSQTKHQRAISASHAGAWSWTKTQQPCIDEAADA